MTTTNQYEPTLETQSPQYAGLAVMIVDMQDKFLSEIDKKDEGRLHETHSNIVRELCINNNVPLINILSGYGGKIDKKTEILSMSVNISKTYYKSNPGAFESASGLEKDIAGMNIKTLFIMGIYATACVLRTAKGAKERNLEVITSRDVIEEEDGCAEDIISAYGDAGIKVYDTCNDFLDSLRKS